MEDKLPYFLAGHEIYLWANWLMQPALTNETREVFNYSFTPAHRINENTFGILLDRWRFFQKLIEK